jgi:uncharacterized membrane protein
MTRRNRNGIIPKTNSHTKQNPPPNGGGLVYSETRYRNAPLPPPDELEAYNNIISNGAERIFQMVETQAAHRIDMENRVLEHDISHSRLGLILGFISQLALIIGGVYVAITQSMWEGLVTALGVIVLGYLNFRLALRRRELDLEEHKMLQDNEKSD